MIPHSTINARQSMFDRHYEAPDPNPDGAYWQRGVRANQDILTDLIGAESYEQWANIVWPDSEMDLLTWAGMYRQLVAAVNEAMTGQRDVTALANAAKYWDEIPGSYGL